MAQPAIKRSGFHPRGRTTYLGVHSRFLKPTFGLAQQDIPAEQHNSLMTAYPASHSLQSAMAAHVDSEKSTPVQAAYSSGGSDIHKLRMLVTESRVVWQQAVALAKKDAIIRYDLARVTCSCTNRFRQSMWLLIPMTGLHAVGSAA